MVWERIEGQHDPFARIVEIKFKPYNLRTLRRYAGQPLAYATNTGYMLFMKYLDTLTILC